MFYCPKNHPNRVVFCFYQLPRFASILSKNYQMKKNTFLLCLLLITVTTSWAQWTNLDLGNLPTSNVKHQSFTLDNNKTPYISYIDGNASNKLVIKKFNGTTWDEIVVPSVNNVLKTMIVFDSNNTMYIGYTTQFSRLVILKLENNQFETLGDKFNLETSSSAYSDPVLKVFNNNPFLFYTQKSTGTSILKKYNSTTNVWDTITDSHFAENDNLGSQHYTIKFDNTGAPYISYYYKPTGSNYYTKIKIKKYDGTNWVQIAPELTAKYSTSDIKGVAVVFKEDIPYLTFGDGVTIFKYKLNISTQTWEEIGKVYELGVFSKDHQIYGNGEGLLIAYRNQDTSSGGVSSIVVESYDGTNWGKLADTNLPSYHNYSFVIKDQYTYYLSGINSNNSNRLEVKKIERKLNKYSENAIGNWSEGTNWSLGRVPNEMDEIEIPTTSEVVLNTSVTLKSLVLKGKLIVANLAAVKMTIQGDLYVNNGTLELHSGASIDIKGTSSGTGHLIDIMDKYRGQELNPNKWYLQSFSTNDYFPNIVKVSTLASGTGDNKGLAGYDNSKTGTGWVYATRFLHKYAFNTQGYAIKVSDVSSKFVKIENKNHNFSSANVSFAAGNRTSEFNSWLLLGNPYLASIAANSNTNQSTTFLSDNIDALDPQHVALYFWNPETASYDVINNSSDAKYIDREEGFFVKSKYKNQSFAIRYDKESIFHNPNISNRKLNSKTQIILKATSAGKTAKTEINYIENATNGLDIGYDAGVFRANASNITLASYLVGENFDTQFAIQCLPKQSVYNSSIALEIEAKKGEKVVIKAAINNLPKETSVLLEDRLNNTLINLTDKNSFYEILFNKQDNIKNRFFLHTKSKTRTIDEINNEVLTIVKTANNNIQIGGVKGKTSVRIFDLQGKEIITSEITEEDTLVRIPKVAKGIYIVKVTTENKQLSKKIIF